MLFGTAIPQHYYDALSGRMMTNGFLARFVTVEIGKRAEGQDAKIITELPPRIIEAAKWWATYRPGGGDLAELHPLPAIVRYTDDARRKRAEARQVFDAEYSKAEDFGDETTMAVFGRAGEHVHKLALLYAISESAEQPTISAAAVEWATEFVTLQAQRALFKAKLHVADNPFHEACQKLKRFLTEAPDRTLFHSKALKAMHCDAQTFQRIAQTLILQGDVESFEQPTRGGRTATVYRLLRV